jgi:hypothetical protein
MELINLKDIKLLYQSAKSSGLQSDINNYIEAVNNSLQNDPYLYASNLEYIITSNHGVKTFREFIEKYGIPLIKYDSIMESFDNAIKQCKYRGIDSSIYNESKEMLESFKNEYKNSFIMFEAYKDELDASHDEYTKLYYNEYFNSNIPKVLSQFGEAAIPDVIITAERNNKADIVFQFLSEAVNSSDGNPTLYQWLLEASKDIKSPSDKLNTLKKKFTEESLEGIVKSIKLKNAILHKESVLMDEEKFIEYTEEEINHMHDYISFKEYYMTTLENFDDIKAIEDDIISIYEEFDGLLPENESCADIVDMLPPTTVSKKVLSKQDIPGLIESTRDKKYGKLPDYLKQHQILSYGEDDNDQQSTIAPETEINADLKPTDYIKQPVPDDITPAKIIVKDNDKVDDDSKPSLKHDGQVNNYYYTYNNSFNKHRNDDHSTHSTLSYNVDTKSDETKTESTDMFSIDIMDGIDVQPKPMSEGAIMTILSTLIMITLFAPIVIFGIGIVGVITYAAVMTKKEAKYVCEMVSKIIGTTIKNLKPYIELASKYFQTHFDNIDSDSILKYFYKSTDGGVEIEEPIKAYFGWAGDKKEMHNEDTLIFVGDMLTGVIQKSNIVKLNNALKKLSTNDISFAIVDLGDDLPGDDNGGIWRYIINAKLVSKGPEDMNEDDDVDGIYDTAYEALQKYAVIEVQMIMSAKAFLNNQVFNESSIINSDDIEPLLNDNESNSDSIFDVIIESTEEPAKPESDHPIRDTLMDIDRNLSGKQQEIKKTVQSAINVGKTFMKPTTRTVGWINGMLNQWKDLNENQMKEKMADPRSRQNLYRAIRNAIMTGSLLKAKLLFNPVFMFLAITNKITNDKNQFRIRNEMIGELKAELEIIDEKIKDAANNGDNTAKYQLIRIKREVTKKLLRVDGGKKIARII